MSVISIPLVKYIVTAALRDKIVSTLFLMILICSSTAMFLGSATITEEVEFTTVFVAGGLRLLGVLGIILFSCFHIRRAFDHKEVEFLLSRPISRVSFLISHAIAFMFIACMIALVITLSLALFSDPNFYGLILWGGSLAVEYMIISTTALFLSMVVSSAAGSALACLGFYVLARMTGTLLGISHVTAETEILEILGKIMEFISIIVPRLDLMAQTEWLVYGTDNLKNIEFMENSTDFSRKVLDIIHVPGFIILQGILFISLLLSSSVVDLLKKRF